jgi:arsenate reductase (thioredoxin)
MSTILFLCQHGGAKSVIAASYFNRAGLPFRAVAAASEEPYEEVLPPVVELLGREGIDVSDFTPRRVEPGDVDAATKVVSIDCELPGVVTDRWDDVPKVSEDLEGATDAIRRHVDTLVAELRGRL